MKIFTRFIIIIIVLMSAAASSAADKKPKIITTVEDLSAIAKEIAGDALDVDHLVPGRANTHLIEMKPSFALKLARADAVIIVGLGLDNWIYRLIENSRNSRLKKGSSGFIDASAACDIISSGSGQIDRSMGDVHPQGNPHYLLDPENGLAAARMFAERFSALFPDKEKIFKKNLADFEQAFRDFTFSVSPTLENIRGMRVITYHKMWDYFARYTKIELLGEIEPKPGIPPTAAHTKNIVDIIKAKSINVIIRSPFYEERTPKKIAADTGAHIVTLSPQTGAVKGVDSYLKMLRFNIERIAEAADGE